jgi:zona occludens toxin (predicted ATPase)
MTVLTEKMVEMGATNSFRIFTFSRVKTSARPMSASMGRYNPLFFTFYKSHDAGAAVKAKERRVDRRQVIWNSPFFKYVMPLSIIIFFYVLYLGYSMYSSRVDALNKKAEQEAAARNRPADIIDHRPPVPAGSQLSPGGVPVPTESSAVSFPSVTGYIQSGSELFVLINDHGNDVLLLDPDDFNVSHMRISGKYNGRPVTSFMSTVVSNSKDSKFTPSSAVTKSAGGGL